jgi:hypothetical protein
MVDMRSRMFLTGMGVTLCPSKPGSGYICFHGQLDGASYAGLRLPSTKSLSFREPGRCAAFDESIVWPCYGEYPAGHNYRRASRLVGDAASVDAFFSDVILINTKLELAGRFGAKIPFQNRSIGGGFYLIYYLKDLGGVVRSISMFLTGLPSSVILS